VPLGEVGVDDGAKRVPAVRPGARGAAAPMVRAVAEGAGAGLGRQRGFAGEVAVEGAVGEAGGAGDVGDRDRVDARVCLETRMLYMMGIM